MPTSIDMVLCCPEHGPQSDPFMVGGTRFCPECVKVTLEGTCPPARRLEMKAVEKTYGEGISGPKTYCRCGHSWHGGGTA